MATIQGRGFLLAAWLLLSMAAGAAEQGPLRSTAPAEASSEQARVIVRYREGSGLVRAAEARGQALAQHAATLGARVGLALQDGRAMGARQQVLQARGLSSQALAERLARDPQVEWAVPDRRRRAAFVPNDPFFAAGQASPMPPAGQWWLRPHDATLVSATRSTVAWDTTRGSGVVVAVLDTGVRSEHPDLAGRFLPGYNMISPDSGGCLTGNGSCRNADATDPGDWVSQSDINNHPSLFDSSCLGDSSWHGTRVSGIVGAGTNNALGVAGVAGQASILPVRVLGKCGGYDSDIIDGMRWAAGLSVAGVPANPNPAQVLNLSLGGSGSCGAYQSAINEITALGVAVVVAAGNEGDAVGAPANCNGVIAVGGLRHVGTKVGYSSLGPQVAISAPAGNCVNETGACLYPIVTTTNDGSTTPGSSVYTDAFNYSVGTSFSAPIVAGTAALMKAANGALDGARIRTLLRATARPFPTTGGDSSSGVCHAPNGTPQDSECYCTTSTCGAGMLDSAAAVAAAVSDVAVALSASPSTPVAGARVSLSSSGSSVGAGRSIASYAWSITRGADLASFVSATNAASATLDTSGAGQVTVALTITDDLGHTGTSTLDLTVAASGLQAAITVTPTSTPKVGDPVTLSAAGSTVDSGRGIAAYQWQIITGDTLAAFSGSTTGATATLVASGLGEVIVRLTITDDQGLSASVDQALSPVADPGMIDNTSGGGGGSSGWFALGLALAGLALRRR